MRDKIDLGNVEIEVEHDPTARFWTFRVNGKEVMKNSLGGMILYEFLKKLKEELDSGQEPVVTVEPIPLEYAIKPKANIYNILAGFLGGDMAEIYVNEKQVRGAYRKIVEALQEVVEDPKYVARVLVREKLMEEFRLLVEGILEECEEDEPQGVAAKGY